MSIFFGEDMHHHLNTIIAKRYPAMPGPTTYVLFSGLDPVPIGDTDYRQALDRYEHNATLASFSDALQQWTVQRS